LVSDVRWGNAIGRHRENEGIGMCVIDALERKGSIVMLYIL